MFKEQKARYEEVYEHVERKDDFQGWQIGIDVMSGIGVTYILLGSLF